MAGTGAVSPALRWEWAGVTLAAALLAAILPLQAGFLGWSWDAINHHVYLGLTAQQPRWQLDVLPASVQTYQYPYLYWPVYLMSQWSGSAPLAGAAWSGFQAAMLAAPVWLLSHRLLPTQDSAREMRLLRMTACAAAFMSLGIVSTLESTASDLMACVPLLWALALSLNSDFNQRRAAAAAALWGVATALKFSNGLFLPWLLLWWYRPTTPHLPLRRAGALALGACLGFGLAYMPWGWQLWQMTGNPFHPFFGSWFGGR